MQENLSPRPKPEEEELKLKKQDLLDLEYRLIEHEVQLTDLKVDLATFDSLYLKTVGVLYADLDELEAKIAELLARSDKGNHRAQRVAKEARERAEESRGAAELTIEDASRFSRSPSLKTLYREVAKKIHPDLAVDEADRTIRERLMAAANRAYEKGEDTTSGDS